MRSVAWVRCAVAGLGLVLAAACAVADTESVSAEDLVPLVDAGKGPVILDVRTPAEYADGHIPGALNIPHDKLRERIDELSAYRDEEIVVHCARGRRAAKAEEILEEAGFTKVRDLDGHWLGWRAAGGVSVTGFAPFPAEEEADQPAGGAQEGGSK